MTETFNVVAETDAPAAGAEQLLDVLADYSPAVGRSPFARTEVTITLPATGLRQAVATAVRVLEDAVAPHRLLSLEVLTTADFDRRAGLTPVPALLSVTEAAQELGVSRQAVLQRIESGRLPATRVGSAWAISPDALAALGKAGEDGLRAVERFGQAAAKIARATTTQD
jgi:excisionase family DNA binding protein